MANLEFLVPPSRFWRAWWWGYTRFVLPAGGWLTGGREWCDGGAVPRAEHLHYYRRYPVTLDGPGVARRPGLVDVGVRTMSLGGGLVMWGNEPRG